MSDLDHLQHVNGALDYAGDKRQHKLENDTIVGRKGESLGDFAGRKAQEAREIEQASVLAGRR